MITHRFPLDAAAEAFAAVTGPEPSIKVVVEP
jgi:threonine dehydrogenase-like Zn-dependent dehydrogenase